MAREGLLDRMSDRRNFLRWGCSAALGSTTLGAALGSLSAVGASAARAASPSDYRALVCVYLSGGNDSFNLIAPTDAAGFSTYQKVRGRLATAPADLLPLRPATSDGHTYGLHPAAAPLRPLFEKGQMAVLANVGSLVQPVTLADVQAGTGLPPQLFSHEDQTTQWMTAQADGLEATGWGGQLGDLLQSRNDTNGLSLNISVDEQRHG